MIDDLIMCGVFEFYWMFMLCVEFCLFLCVDNVDQCFMLLGWDIGLVFDQCWQVFDIKLIMLNNVCEFLFVEKYMVCKIVGFGIKLNLDGDS